MIAVAPASLARRTFSLTLQVPRSIKRDLACRLREVRISDTTLTDVHDVASGGARDGRPLDRRRVAVLCRQPPAAN